MPKDVHIGKKIHEVLTQTRYKKTEFADMINISRTVVYDIFKRKTIDTGLLRTIGDALNHDFFSYYDQQKPGFAKESKVEYGYATKSELSELTYTVKQLAKQIEQLREELPRKEPAKKRTAKK